MHNTVLAPKSLYSVLIMKTSSVHIVRRYGLVGGMENYVYHLVSTLAEKGQGVTVLCESNEAPVLDDSHQLSPVNVIVLGNRFRKPRWLAQWGFSQRVSEYLVGGVDGFSTDQNTIIHSHERTANHHVTTFHGPPFLMRKRRLLDFLSPRIHMWTHLEKQEMLGDQVQAILPNSPLIADQLTALYPAVAHKVLAPAYPGVMPSYAMIQRDTSVMAQGRLGFTVGFLGKEWKRKGLDIACQIVNQLREQLPQVHFVVAGCDPQEVQSLFTNWPKEAYTLLGWTDPEVFLGKVDLLLHPARSEPFGMVVAEANAAGLPVVVSDLCGVAALVTPDNGDVCALDVDHPNIAQWVNACARWLSVAPKVASAEELRAVPRVTSLNLTWDGLAEQHITLYQSLT